MSNVTIPDLPAGAVPTTASQFESVEGGASVRYTAAQIVGAGSAGTFLTKANNLSDVASAPAARTNLGLGNVENKSSAMIRSEITPSNVTGALGYTPLNPANNLSDVASVAAARANLGITASGADAAYAWRTNNLSDLTNVATARTNLGLGTAAVKNTGTSGNTVPLLDAANTFSGATNVFNGNVGIGRAPTAPNFIIDAYRDFAGNLAIQLTNANVGTGAYSAFTAVNSSTAAAQFGMLGVAYTGGGGVYRNNGAFMAGIGGGGVSLITQDAQPIYLCTNNTERMRIDASGTSNFNGNIIGLGSITIANTASFGLGITVGNNGNDGVINLIRNDGVLAAKIGELPGGNGTFIDAGGNQPIVFFVSPGSPAQVAEKMRIDAAGNVLIGNAAQLASEKLQVSKGAAGEYTAMFINTNVTPAGAIPIAALFTGGSPNDANTSFVHCGDTVAPRVKILSNGGLANYSANNVNLSDANVKDQITPYSKTELAALEQSFTNVIWGKFKYRDQTHDDWNHGPTAQGVERAFENSAPELVDESELGAKPESGVKHKVIYETDLAHIAHALLAKALAEIADLKMRLAKVGA